MSAMKSSGALWVLIMVAGACAPAWSQDDQGDLQGDPYDSGSSAGALGAHNPFDPDSLTRRYGAYGKRFGQRYDLNPYGSEAPRASGAEGDSGEEDEANPYGLDPYDSYSRSQPYGESLGTYGHSPDAGRRASDLLKHYDQFGHYNDGLTTYPYDPCAVSAPYERAGEPCAGGQANFGDDGNPYNNRSLENPHVPGAPGNYGQYGYYGGTVSNPYDPYRLPQPYSRSDEPFGRAPVAPPGPGAAENSPGGSTANSTSSDAALKSSLDSLNRQLNQAEANLRAAGAPGLPDQRGGHDQGSAAASGTPPDRPNSKPRDGNPHGGRAAAKPKTPDQIGVHNGESDSSDSQNAVDPVARGVHSTSSGGAGNRPGTTDSRSPTNQTNP
jgi:hypothetical protein